MTARSAKHRPPPDVYEFLIRALPMLKDAGYTVRKPSDVRWLRPEGVTVKDFVSTEEDLHDGSVRSKQWHNTIIVEVRRANLWARVVITGHSSKDRFFEMRDSHNRTEKMATVGPGILNVLVAKVDEMAAVKVKAALKLKHTFNLE